MKLISFTQRYPGDEIFVNVDSLSYVRRSSDNAAHTVLFFSSGAGASIVIQEEISKVIDKLSGNPPLETLSKAVHEVRPSQQTPQEKFKSKEKNS